MKYCDDIECPHLSWGECDIGFRISFRPPKSMADVQSCNWGYKMPRVCILRLKSKHTKLMPISETTTTIQDILSYK